MDIKVRRNGKDIWLEADWLSNLRLAIKSHKEAIAIKPDASALKAHDDALIERCAGLINKLEEAKRNPFSRDHNNGLQHAIDIIRELKECK